MTESEWLSCEDPEKMLEFLRGRASDRKLRLFAVACCRGVWHWLANPRIEYPGEQKAVGTTEEYADGLATAEELGAAASLTRLNAAARAWGNESLYAALAAAAAATKVGVSVETAWEAARWSAAAAETAYGGVEATPYPEGYKLRAGLIRDIFGNPFRPLSIAPAVLATQGGVVVRMASAIYTDRRWEDIPLLGDALEDVGCTDRDVLEHCREGPTHARGCHVVDAILGKS